MFVIWLWTQFSFIENGLWPNQVIDSKMEFFNRDRLIQLINDSKNTQENKDALIERIKSCDDKELKESIPSLITLLMVDYEEEEEEEEED